MANSNESVCADNVLGADQEIAVPVNNADEQSDDELRRGGNDAGQTDDGRELPDCMGDGASRCQLCLWLRNPSQRLYSLKAAAAMLGVGQRTLFSMRKDGEIATVDLGAPKIDILDIHEAIESRKRHGLASEESSDR